MRLKGISDQGIKRIAVARKKNLPDWVEGKSSKEFALDHMVESLDALINISHPSDMFDDEYEWYADEVASYIEQGIEFLQNKFLKTVR